MVADAEPVLLKPSPVDAAVGSADAGRSPVRSRIGPNAITRLAEALDSLHGVSDTQALFAAAGLESYLQDPPTEMVDERHVIALHRAGRRIYEQRAFSRIARLAGELTGDYVLANRIPRPAQRVLRPLPAGLAARVLVRAIGAHAWTFVGSGRFSYEARRGGMRLIIEDSPLARDEQADEPLCDYYTATFERIFRELVAPRTRVVETACAAMGAPSCVFDIRFRP